MKKILNKFFVPNKIMGFLIFNVSFILLIYVFITKKEYTPLAYISYLLSTYSLIIFCVWFYKICQFSNDFIKSSKLYKIYQSHLLKVIKITLIVSVTINLLYGIFKFIIGIYYKSWWFVTFAIYYFILCVMKILIIKNIRKKEKDIKKEYRILKHTGIILLFLNFFLSGIIILIIVQDKIVDYGGILIYIVAMYDFYLIISAIVNLVKSRKKHSPILISSKCVNLTVAMISMVSLEVAMVYQFGNNDSNFKLIMTSCMGFAICIVNSTMAIYMMLKANKYLRRNS